MSLLTDSEKLDRALSELAILRQHVMLLEQLLRGQAPINHFGTPLQQHSWVDSALPQGFCWP
jgi:hypothetical protein